MIIRPPEVVPGLAEISVRVPTGSVQRVTVLPVYFRAGRKGAPPPDMAIAVPGEPNLYSSQLWLMESGAYSVDVSVEGKEGQGTVVVPVNSVAMSRKPMKPWFGAMLATLGGVLFIGMTKLAGAAFGESIVEPGLALSRRQRWYSRFGMIGGATIFVLVLSVGKKWWDKDDREYRNNRLYRPTPITAQIVLEKDQPTLQLKIEEGRKWTPLIPDHGKMMHLFMVREPSLNAFAHLHPIQKESRKFVAAMPPLPEGQYQLYADITHENGFSETLTATVQIPSMPETYSALWKMPNNGEAICASAALLASLTNFIVAPDMDDSWHISPGSAGVSPANAPSRTIQTPSAPLSRMEENSSLRTPSPPLGERDGVRGSVAILTDGYKLVWENYRDLDQKGELSLTFKLLDPNGRPAPLESYMGMLGHAAVRRNDGAVFAHLHPAGTFSMASLQFFQSSIMGATAPDRSYSAPQASIAHTNHVILSTNGIATFPYEFPKPGPYRIWVQLKSSGKVLTGAFDTQIPPDNAR